MQNSTVNYANLCKFVFYHVCFKSEIVYKEILIVLVHELKLTVL